MTKEEFHPLIMELQGGDFQDLESLAVAAYNKAIDDAISHGFLSDEVTNEESQMEAIILKRDIEKLKIKIA